MIAAFFKIVLAIVFVVVALPVMAILLLSIAGYIITSNLGL